MEDLELEVLLLARWDLPLTVHPPLRLGQLLHQILHHPSTPFVSFTIPFTIIAPSMSGNLLAPAFSFWHTVPTQLHAHDCARRLAVLHSLPRDDRQFVCFFCSGDESCPLPAQASLQTIYNTARTTLVLIPQTAAQPKHAMPNLCALFGS